MSIISPKCGRTIISPSPKNMQNTYHRRASAAAGATRQFAPSSGFNLQPKPTHMAQNFGDCVDSYD